MRSIKVLQIAICVLILNTNTSNCVAQINNFLPVDGKRIGIKGVNLPWLDGAYGHDFGKSAKEGWQPAYNKNIAETRFTDIARMDANVMRLWVFQGSSGIVMDSDGYASHIDRNFLRNLKEAIAIADSKGVNCYLCLINSVGGEFKSRSGGKDIVIDPKARSRFFDNIVVPFTKEFKGNSGVFAFDLINEPEDSVYGDCGWAKQGTAYSWEQMRSFIKAFAASVHSVDRSRLVSVGAGNANALKKGYYLGLGLDFFDYHSYSDNGELEHSNEIRRNWIKTNRAPQHEFNRPILIGECGQRTEKSDDELQRKVTANYLKNAKNKGYAGALIWSYEWPNAPEKEWDRLLKGGGDPSWRPAAYEIKNFRWTDIPRTNSEPNKLLKVFTPILYLPCDSALTGVTIRRKGGKNTEGKIGNGIYFDGSQFSELEIDLPQANSPRSLALWAKNDRGPVKEGIHIITHGLVEKAKPFGIMEAGGMWRFFDLNGGLSSEVKVDKQWHHHVVTHDAKTIRYYLDGKEIQNVERKLSTANGTLKIGGLGDKNNNFVGTLDEIYFFDFALNHLQIQELFLAGQ